jgi:ATP-dependent exoDNAse (exonuclease V) alpha subunit
MIQNHFQHINLTEDQKLALDKFEKFLSSDSSIFVLKGYAGSGKTTILSGIVEYLTDSKKKSLLMAPTGRAAKVINAKTKKVATTIHKGIYSLKC